MSWKNKLAPILSHDWFIALFLSGIFFLTNGYTFAWDDQHLEIPLLKGLIDPALYPGDYYIQSLKHNFLSLMYPVLARLISTDGIEPAYLILYLVSRCFMFFWIYKIWRTISGKTSTAIFTVLAMVLLVRQEEFLYRTFSHQEFALAFIFAGIYYFYRDRFLLAAAVLGVAANFHALYSLFPMLYVLAYLLFNQKTQRIKTLLKAGGMFILCALPLVVLSVRKYIFTAGHPDPQLYAHWPDIYSLACPQNYIFNTLALDQLLDNRKEFFKTTAGYWPLLTLGLLNWVHLDSFRRDSKAQAILWSAGGMLILSFFFSYIWPSHFVLDLNLVRNTQYIFFILTGYTIILIDRQLDHRPLWLGAVLITLLSVFRFSSYNIVWASLAILFLLSLGQQARARPVRYPAIMALTLGLLASLAGIIYQFKTHRFNPIFLNGFGIALIGVWAVLLADLAGRHRWASVITPARVRILLMSVPFLVLVINNAAYHKLRIKVEQTNGGFWQLQRNWIDMQKYVKAHTPKSALFLIPNDMEMGGFRIHSERPVVVCYRDCGIVGFDYPAAVEWQNRLKDVASFQVIAHDPIVPAVMNAILKYRVNYIVFMNYLDPGASGLLEQVYQNEAFVLYKVLSNPAP